MEQEEEKKQMYFSFKRRPKIQVKKVNRMCILGWDWAGFPKKKRKPPCVSRLFLKKGSRPKNLPVKSPCHFVVPFVVSSCPSLLVYYSPYYFYGFFTVTNHRNVGLISYIQEQSRQRKVNYNLKCLVVTSFFARVLQRYTKYRLVRPSKNVYS